jgi:hypothetical protein
VSRSRFGRVRFHATRAPQWSLRRMPRSKGSPADLALEPTIEAEVWDDVDTIVRWSAIARRRGRELVCDRCEAGGRPVVALLRLQVTPPLFLGLCSVCYRRLCELVMADGGLA